MIELLGELEVGVFATIHTPVAATRQERARARSLRHMVEILDHEGVGELMIESRGPQDTHDRRVLLSATEDGLCSGDLSYSFETKAEPLMWLPDAIAGLLGEAECGRDPRWIAHLQHVAHIVDIRRLGP
jgi:hypothetical protein